WAEVLGPMGDPRGCVAGVVCVVVRVAGERLPRGRGPVSPGVPGTAGLEQDRPGLRVLDDRRDDRDPAALVGRVRVGLDGGGGTADEKAVVDVHATEVEQ